MHEQQLGFGIDIGGSGTKGALVNLHTGEFVGERIKFETPKPATPEAVAATAARIVKQAGWDGPVGITLPGVVRGSTMLTAANIDPSWLHTNIHEVFGAHLGDRPITFLNDADAAGLAEVAYGNPQAKSGAVIFLTLGTGIGSAFLVEGKLFPNTELGHLFVDGEEAEKLASSGVKKSLGLSYQEWAPRLEKVLSEYERLFNPTAFVIGGGISRKSARWLPLLHLATPIIPATLLNRAGIVGAALAAREPDYIAD
ncbi:polyphosphate--glucose phosphotransferase [Corynebacterium sp. MNWGS58]|uniref:polyphosphate--glucose phosphotransferase n=1 Tax=Corynebacterium sp. 102791.4 TaxID=3104612 RepID=UPI003514336E